jgi:hypothetical protein
LPRNWLTAKKETENVGSNSAVKRRKKEKVGERNIEYRKKYEDKEGDWVNEKKEAIKQLNKIVISRWAKNYNWF